MEHKWNWILEFIQAKGKKRPIASGDLVSKDLEDARNEALDAAKPILLKLFIPADIWNLSVGNWEIETSQTSSLYLSFETINKFGQFTYKLYVKFW